MTSKLINNYKSNTKPHIDKVNRGHRLFKTLASKSAKEHHFCDFSLIQSLTKPQITGGQIEVYLCIRLSKKRGRRGCLALYIFNNRDRALTESMRVFGESNHHTTMLSFLGIHPQRHVTKTTHQIRDRHFRQCQNLCFNSFGLSLRRILYAKKVFISS